ncbi:hypothetical protein [Planktotalea sp.]|uniref:hypothetical protein n=1 Tax=Planktotalea sp. TaxID=2029877 RepID=UPI00329A399A
MKKAFVLITALAMPTASFADFYSKSTDQFGFLAVDVAPDFRLAAMCTVSNGEIDQLGDYASWLPVIGEKLAKVMKVTSLNKGETVCGLRHSTVGKIVSKPAKSKGFDLQIRTYAGGKLLAMDAPTSACKTPQINVISICFEFVRLKENEAGAEADAATACIDVHKTDDTAAGSIVLGAGKIPQDIKDQMRDEAAAWQTVSCASRQY